MKKLLCVFFIFVSFYASAQYFQTGQDPAAIKWRQINTQNFQLIYPDYYENQAQQLAQKLERVYEYGSYSLGYKPKKISVILHTQTVKSNGLVAYAPKRSEFYTTPHQSIYPQDWLEQLVLHEFRHVVQIDKVNEALPNIIKILLGEQGTALVFGAYLPWWFIEGDAVVTETALGKFGRGRFPSFLIEHRAQVVEKGKYSYDKAYLGSYKNFVANHYSLGYYLVASSRERYGSELWEKVLSRVGKKPFSLAPFNKALKLETGFTKVQLYNSIFDSLAVVWKNQDKNFVPASSNIISQKSKTFTNYQYNHWLNSSEIISYKTALNKIPSFVKVNKNGNEKRIINTGSIFDESVDHRGEWIVWSEQIPNLRWQHSGRSKINLLNVESKKKISFKPEFKGFAPSISPDFKNVVLVETDFSSNYYLSVYRISDGELLHRIQTEENNYFFSPKWLNENELVAVILTSKGKRLAKFDLKTGEHKILYNHDIGELKQLRVTNNQLYFIAGLSGKNALYSYNFENQQIYHLYEPRFSVEYPSLNSDNKLVLSDYTANGFRIIELEKVDKMPLNQVIEETYPLAQKIANQEIGIPDLSTNDSIKFTSEKYSKPRHLLNFHSWAPLFIDVNSYEISSGVSLMSQNKLGTAETVLGYRWDTAEETGQFYGSYTYKGWYPVLRFEASTGKRASNYWLITENSSNGEVVSRDTSIERFTWKENVFNTEISLPLNLTSGPYTRLLQPKIAYDLTLYNNDNSTPENFPDGDYHAFSYNLYYHQLLRQSYQDVYPNFGFVVDGTFKHSPNGLKGLGNLSAAQSIIYIPGLMANHGTKIYLGVQQKERGETFRFSDVVRFPRGWKKIETNELTSLGLDYKMPLFNPDWSIASLVYLRRINATLFADYGKLKGNYYHSNEVVGTYETNISTYGLELLGEVNFLRFYAPVNIGVRTSYLKEIENFTFDFLISVDFTSL